MYSFLGSRDDSGDYEAVYYNCDIVNGRVVDQGSGTDPEVQFNETRDSPMIKNASNYEFAIVRFTMNGAGRDLPMWMPVIEMGLTPPVVAGVQPSVQQIVATNKSVYKITLRAVLNGVEYYSSEYSLNPTGDTTAGLPPALNGVIQQGNSLIFVPEDMEARRPLPQQGVATTTQDTATRYYYISTYKAVESMVNNTFAQAWQDIENQFTTAFPLLQVQSHCPIMKYNSTTGLFELYCDAYGWGSDGFGGAGATLANPVMLGVDNTRSNTLVGSTQTENWDMFFNSNMYGLFANFPMRYWGGDVATNNRTYQILTYVPRLLPAPPLSTTATIGGIPGLTGTSADVDNNRIFAGNGNALTHAYPGVVGPTAVECMMVKQDYSSTSSLWSPIESIVFTTTLIPVVNEYVGQPQRFGDSNDASSSTTQNAFQPIITDIALPMGSADDYRHFVEYVPSAEYRMISLSSSNQEIKNIDVQVYWKNRMDGSLIPVQMFNLSSISMKMMFRRKK